MNVSRSSEYALMSAAYIAANPDDYPIRADRIAQEFGIAVEYLLKILQQLVRAGVLVSKRGPRGGFALARAAGDIHIAEIIEAVEGPIRWTSYMDELTDEPFAVKMEQACNQAAEAARQVCAKASLAQMVRGR